MEMTKYLIIPDRENMDESINLSLQYHLGFEFNDFFVPTVLQDEKKYRAIRDFYQSKPLPELCTSHGAFFDIIVFSEDPEIAKVSEMRVRQSMDIANELGAKGVIFHTNIEPMLTSEIYRKNWLDRTKNFFTIICGEYPHINVYMENMFDKDPEELCKLAEAMKDVPNFGVCFDYAHAYISHTGVSEWAKTLGPYIRHVHINDNDGENDLHLAVGEGVIDWKKFLKLQKEYFPDATVLVETSTVERQRKSLEFMEDAGFFAE